MLYGKIELSMLFDFYHSDGYRKKQSLLTQKHWRQGVFDHLRKTEKRKCHRNDCGVSFVVNPSNPKIYCSRSCAAKTNNEHRGARPEAVKLKIAKAMTGKKYPTRTRTLIKQVCANPKCAKTFLSAPWMKRKFCSLACSTKIIGGQITSPKADRGKAGIRKDISKTIYFYSRWEANIARFYNHLGIIWEYAPSVFDIGGQMYTPDFYLPERDTYVEVKNFWWRYSKERDKKFRKLYPHLKLEVILKKDYLAIEKRYSSVISNWEYRNSPFN